MIVSASYRTDVPAFYGEWLMRRLDAGWCDVPNPYGSKPWRVDLAPETIDGLVLWTRNLVPFERHLDTIRRRGHPFVVQYTVTGYPRALEASVPDPARAVECIRRTVERFGAGTVVWRYDPVFTTTLTPAAWHRATFARLADAMAGLVDEVVVSFAAIYRKTARNADAAARRHGFAWHDPSADEKRALLADLAALARARDIALTLCAQPELERVGVPAARCIDADRLARVGGRPVPAREKGNRAGCRCAESRDIGTYDTCPHGCVYCYAVAVPGLAKRRLAAHDTTAPML